jgi:hypothetical protein
MLQVRDEIWEESYFCAFFNDATCASGYFTCNCGIVGEFRIGKRIGRKCCGQFEFYCPRTGTEKKSTKHSVYLCVPVDWKLVQIVVQCVPFKTQTKLQSRSAVQKLNQKAFHLV